MSVGSLSRCRDQRTQCVANLSECGTVVGREIVATASLTVVAATASLTVVATTAVALFARIEFVLECFELVARGVERVVCLGFVCCLGRAVDLFCGGLDSRNECTLTPTAVSGVLDERL